MAAKRARRNAVAVGDLATELLDPLLRKRAGMSIALLQSWDEIVGERLADMSRPEKIAWPRRAHEDDPFEPATLIVACEGVAAMRIQHETGEIIARVNAFLGFNAIGRIRILQKKVAPPASRPRPKPRPGGGCPSRSHRCRHRGRGPARSAGASGAGGHGPQTLNRTVGAPTFVKKMAEFAIGRGPAIA
jgi:hypothetical protein